MSAATHERAAAVAAARSDDRAQRARFGVDEAAATLARLSAETREVPRAA